MSIYAIGDLHLSFDPTVDKPMDVFGPGWTDHEDRIRENWIENVRDNDTVIIAGDVSWGLKLQQAAADFEWIDSLPGKKLIFKGNHDLWWNGINRMNGMYDSITFVQNKAVYVEGWYICGSRGWACPGDPGFTEEDEKIYNREVLRLRMSIDDAIAQEREINCGAGIPRILGVLHYPPTNDKLQPSDFTKIFAEAGASKVVYGHLHGRENFHKGLQGNFNGVEYILASVDKVDCRLVKLV
ncbi:MAG: metallophosphoesterase [Firmicutes bacterium]|nr:metallophosphoesterase [Bacillota bacterium]